MLVLIIGIVVFGLVPGALARLAVLGPDPMPLWLTTLVGIVGSVAGGLVARIFLGSEGSLLFAFLGAVAVVIAYRRLVQHREITGPGAHTAPTRGVGVHASEARHAKMLAELTGRRRAQRRRVRGETAVAKGV